MFTKILHTTTATSLITIAIIGLILVWNRFVPMNILDIDNPIQVKAEDYIVINEITYPIAYAGEEFVVRFTYNKHLSYNEHTFRTILCEDGNLVTITDIKKNMPLGEHTIDFGLLVLPNKTSTNTLCKVRYLITYRPSNDRIVTVPTETELFYVQDRGGDE